MRPQLQCNVLGLPEELARRNRPSIQEMANSGARSVRVLLPPPSPAEAKPLETVTFTIEPRREGSVEWYRAKPATEQDRAAIRRWCERNKVPFVE